MGLLDALTDKQFWQDIGSNATDLAQGASNSQAGMVSGPVDVLAWLLRKAGVPVPSNPLGGSDWMAQQGLTAQPKNHLLGLLGEGVGGVAPMVAAAKAPQIANGLLNMADNVSAPATLNSQRGMALIDTKGMTREEARSLVQSRAEKLASQLNEQGFQASVQHSGSAAGPSSYIDIFDPQTGRKLTQQVRVSGHSKGAFNSGDVWNVSESEFPQVVDAAKQMRDLGATDFWRQKLAQESAQAEAMLNPVNQLAPGVRPQVTKAFQEARDTDVPFTRYKAK